MAETFEKIRIGVIGAGGFTRFSLEAFLRTPGTEVAAVFDINPVNAGYMLDKHRCRVYDTAESLLDDPEIGIVYIATPPFLHYAQSKKALQAGKHVICEKPAALKAGEVAELIKIAKDKELLYVVNLMQRYNPLFPMIKNLIDKQLLGGFLHGYFENYASDETLDEEHWMWDEEKSGGIFIEHAVHFFDLIEGWLGQGELIASQKISRKGKAKVFYPEVQAICKYGNGLFNFYHGFHQANRMDRQELKLVFESGDVTLYEWVPSRMLLNGLVTHEDLAALEKIFPGARIKIVKSFEDQESIYKSHGADRKADHQVLIEYGDNSLKYTIYQQLLSDMFSDQLHWIRDRGHQRRITEINALNSVSMADLANQSAILL